ncbi:Panacea domain-containing protein [Arthrobacter sp. TMN-37]
MASTSIVDVAQFILSENGPMSTMKLQKLCYFSQGWFLAWTSRPLFREDFQAWANGPVCRELYNLHRGDYGVDKLNVNSLGQVTDQQKRMIRAVLESYGQMSGYQLSELTHKGRPWKSVRDRLGLVDGQRSEAVIDKEAMLDYFSNL